MGVYFIPVFVERGLDVDSRVRLASLAALKEQISGFQELKDQAGRKLSWFGLSSGVFVLAVRDPSRYVQPLCQKFMKLLDEDIQHV